MKSESKYLISGFIIAILIFAVFIFMKNKSFDSETIASKEINKPVINFDEIMQLPQVVNGKELFKENCAACHRLFNTDAMPLQGIEERVRDRQLLYNWIRNPAQVIKSGNPYFVAMYKEYGIMMTASPNLNDSDINNILDYIKVATAQRQYQFNLNNKQFDTTK